MADDERCVVTLAVVMSERRSGDRSAVVSSLLVAAASNPKTEEEDAGMTQRSGSSGLMFMDLFAGAGGLSEGFVRAGFQPVSHVEADRGACFTLRTRAAYHWLREQDDMTAYYDYLSGRIGRQAFYSLIPEPVLNSVIEAEIGTDSMSDIFRRTDELLNGRRLDLIIGGPPCQAYSLVGRARDRNRMKKDRRNYLYLLYAEFLRRYRPLYFVFENVTGLLSARDDDGTLHFEAMRDLFRDCGYETEFLPLAAQDYGVLQSRIRIILVGRRGRRTGFFPEPEKWSPSVTVGEALRDLPSIQSGEGTLGPCRVGSYAGTWQYRAGIRNEGLPVTFHQARPHCGRDLEIYRIAVGMWDRERKRLRYDTLPENLKTHRARKSFEDRFKVVAGDLPFAQTVVAHIARDGHYYIHPDIRQNRSLTPREAARLQTFPDDYFFENSREQPARTPAFRQIGNAVPVLLARKLASRLLERWH